MLLAQKNRLTNFRINELRHQILTSVQVINFGTLLFHGAEVNISIELGAEVTRGEHRLPQISGKLLSGHFCLRLYFIARNHEKHPPEAKKAPLLRSGLALMQ